MPSPSRAENHVLAEGDGVGGVEGGGEQFEAVAGIAVGIDAEEVEEGVEIEDVLTARPATPISPV